jgi:threonine dehydrogenase-like Zn-dependent dehydrogenase
VKAVGICGSDVHYLKVNPLPIASIFCIPILIIVIIEL